MMGQPDKLFFFSIFYFPFKTLKWRRNKKKKKCRKMVELEWGVVNLWSSQEFKTELRLIWYQDVGYFESRPSI